MHPNPAFRRQSHAANIAFARSKAFGVLAINGEDGPLTVHIPFLLEEDGALAELHLVRSNPIVKAVGQGAKAVITVMGPNGYISPDWYGIKDQVPTWNYIAVRIEGQLKAEPAETLHPMLDRLSAHFENQLLPKTPWTTDKMTDGVMGRMMRSIVPFRLDVSAIHGTWKLNQNKPDDVRLRAAAHVETDSVGDEVATLAEMMRYGADGLD